MVKGWLERSKRCMDGRFYFLSTRSHVHMDETGICRTKGADGKCSGLLLASFTYSNPDFLYIARIQFWGYGGCIVLYTSHFKGITEESIYMKLNDFSN